MTTTAAAAIAPMSTTSRVSSNGRLAKLKSSSRHKHASKTANTATTAASQSQRLQDGAGGAGDELVLTMNPFLNDFIDCIENLPNQLQLLLSELRSVDALSNALHRKIQCIKQELITKTTPGSCSSSPASTASSNVPATGDDEPTTTAKTTTAYSAMSVDQMLSTLHHVLIQCQELGDQKVRLTGQVMEILSSKTRQLGLETKSLEERKFNIELDEEKIVSEFKLAIKNRSMYSHYHTTNYTTGGGSGGQSTSRTSTRNYQAASTNGLTSSASKVKQQTQLNSVDVNKAVSKYLTSKSTARSSASAAAMSAAASASIQANGIDAYSFEDQPSQMASSPFGRNGLTSSKLRGAAGSSLSSLSGGKKGNLRNQASSALKTAKTEPASGAKRGASVAKKRFEAPESKATGLESSRPKRQLNYTSLPSSGVNKSAKKSSSASQLPSPGLNKKRRLNQLKQSSASSNQCKSPSSSSTSSTATNQNSRSASRLGQSRSAAAAVAAKLTNGARFGKASESAKSKSKKLLKKKDKVKRLSGSVTFNGGKSVKSKASKSNESVDDADDDDSDSNADDNSNENFNSSNEEMDYQMAENGGGGGKATAGSNDERNSNETESINQIDDDDDDDEELDGVNGSELDDLIRDSGCDDEAASNEEEADESGDDDDEGAEEEDEDEENEANEAGQEEDEDAHNAAAFESEEEDGRNSDSDSFVPATTNKSSSTAANSRTSKNGGGSEMHVFGASHDEPVYCLCREISYGQMICCDNDACKIEWFHFSCVSLNSKPKGKWYCPNCRGDTHKVMKKVASTGSNMHSSPSSSLYGTTGTGYSSNHLTGLTGTSKAK